MNSTARLLRVLFAALLLMTALGPRTASAADTMVYRVELASGPPLLAKSPPVPHGARLVFARHPDGALVSVKRGEVKRVVSVPVVVQPAAASATAIRNLRPGEMLILGPTGEGASGSTAAGGGTTSTSGGGRPGEAAGGKAMFNPTRDYRPEWDARQVPGASVAFPSSPSDYREGGTLAYPPGSGTQSSPGQPPTGVPSGPPLKSPQ